MISFCIITIGQQPEKLRLTVKSIEKNFISENDYEIIIVGNNVNQFSDLNCKIIADDKYIEFLGKRRNIATSHCSNNIIVHCDEDILFPNTWYDQFLKYNQSNPNWQVLGNKILLPDGKRYWDRNTYYPHHKMVEYDYYSLSDTFYQAGCFGIYKKELLNNISWDEKIPFYGMFKGFSHNEDIEFSLKLKSNNIEIFFDKNNTVWHNDFTYSSNDIICNKHNLINYIEYKSLEYIKLINKLSK